MKIRDNIEYIGVNDHDIDLFEGQYKVPNGMSYNSYVILDEKIAVLDTVDKKFVDTWLKNLDSILCGREPDYLIVHHMEPDHSSGIAHLANKYKNLKIVASAKAFDMMNSFFGCDFADRRVVISEGDTLSLGKHTLNFISAPMVHWPEVMLSYEGTSKILFSADAFGKFGANDIEDDWVCEARRYYIGIVGKYGAQVQALLKKAAGLDIQLICPLHGPVLSENLSYYINLYNIWSSYGVERDGVLIAYTSVYGNTEKAVKLLASKLSEGGVEVKVHDLAREDMSEAVESAFMYGKLVLATTTYNGGIFPFMHDFINHLKDHNFSGRRVAFIENGSWAPMAERVMRELLSRCKGITYCENNVGIRSALDERSTEQLDKLAKELI